LHKTGVAAVWHWSDFRRVNMAQDRWMSASACNDSGCETCPLNLVQAGVAVRIKQLCAAPEVQKRLREIGLYEDQVVRLLTSRNNFICQVCNARLAISEQLARLILVEPVLQTIPVADRV
jgi:Fe2+ transport system protein FeoA